MPGRAMHIRKIIILTREVVIAIVFARLWRIELNDYLYYSHCVPTL